MKSNIETKQSNRRNRARRAKNWWMIPVVAVLVSPAPSWSQFKEPVLTEITAGVLNEWAPTFSSDMLEVYWVADPGGGGRWDVWSSRRESIDDPWQDLQPLDVVNTGKNESTPHLSYDGLTLTFTSNGREGGYGGLDLWQTYRASRNDPWLEPVNMGPTINTRRNEGSASFSADGLEIIFNSGCPGGGCSPTTLRRSTRETLDDEWTTPVEMTPSERGDQLSVGAYPSLSPDGLSLYYNRLPGSFGFNLDVFVSKRPSLDALFGEGENLGATINSSGRDVAARIARDGSLYYTYDTSRGVRIWRTEAELPGDANSDGEVSFADFLVLSENFGEAGGWSEGDFDLNGVVEFADFLLLSNNFGRTSIAAAAVPEPNGLIVVCLGLLGLVTFRRHHRSSHR